MFLRSVNKISSLVLKFAALSTLFVSYQSLSLQCTLKDVVVGRNSRSIGRQNLPKWSCYNRSTHMQAACWVVKSISLPGRYWNTYAEVPRDRKFAAVGIGDFSLLVHKVTGPPGPLVTDFGFSCVLPFYYFQSRWLQRTTSSWFKRTRWSLRNEPQGLFGQGLVYIFDIFGRCLKGWKNPSLLEDCSHHSCS